MDDRVWLKTPKEKIKSLLSDEAKNSDMLSEMASTIKQMKAKSAFRLALINQLNEELKEEKNK